MAGTTRISTISTALEVMAFSLLIRFLAHLTGFFTALVRKAAFTATGFCFGCSRTGVPTLYRISLVRRLPMESARLDLSLRQAMVLSTGQLGVADSLALEQFSNS